MTGGTADMTGRSADMSGASSDHYTIMCSDVFYD